MQEAAAAVVVGTGMTPSLLLLLGPAAGRGDMVVCGVCGCVDVGGVWVVCGLGPSTKGFEFLNWATQTSRTSRLSLHARREQCRACTPEGGDADVCWVFLA